MSKTLLAAVVAHCDEILRTKEIGDYDGAANGLQVENSGRVSRIAATVDASLATVKLAVAAGADLLIVASRSVLECAPAMDRDKLRTIPVAGGKQSRGLQLTPAAGFSS